MKKTYTTNKPTLTNLRTFAAESAAEELERTGRLIPAFICFGRRSGPHLFLTQLTDDASKDEFVKGIRLLCIAEDAQAAVFIAESWMGAQNSLVRPSESPNRREVITVRIELPGNQGEINIYPILRDSNGKPRLGELEFQSPLTGLDRFSRFLPDTAPSEGEQIIAKTILQRSGRMVPLNLHQSN